MADLSVPTFLERVVNTRTKLHILLVFYENRHMRATIRDVAQRCSRDIWSIEQAIEEMAATGLFTAVRSIGGDTLYVFDPDESYVEPIQELMRQYDDPLEREELFQIIHELSTYGAMQQSFDQYPRWSRGDVFLAVL
jgi:hypothetical protein